MLLIVKYFTVGLVEKDVTYNTGWVNDCLFCCRQTLAMFEVIPGIKVIILETDPTNALTEGAILELYRVTGGAFVFKNQIYITAMFINISPSMVPAVLLHEAGHVNQVIPKRVNWWGVLSREIDADSNTLSSPDLAMKLAEFLEPYSQQSIMHGVRYRKLMQALQG